MHNNGKKTEAAVQAALKSIDAPMFDWQRLYDSTSARGVFMAQTGDFLFFMPGVHGVLEVKSTQHEYRLTKAAFSDGQRAKLRRRMDAGGSIWVLVHHWKTNVWRCVPYALCHEAFDIRQAASMDLRVFPERGSAAEAVVYVIEESLGC